MRTLSPLRSRRNLAIVFRTLPESLAAGIFCPGNREDRFSFLFMLAGFFPGFGLSFCSAAAAVRLPEYRNEDAIVT